MARGSRSSNHTRNMGLIINIAATFIAFTTLAPTILLLGLLLSHRKELHKNPLPPKKLPFVSIIIPAYNEEKTIVSTVCSASALNYPKEKLEIIVVNDGSKDRTKEVCEVFQKRGDIILINQENAGTRIAKGDIIVCLDADSEPHPDALTKMISFFDDKNVAAVTAAMKVKNTDNILSSVQAIEYLFSIIARKLLSYVNAVVVIPGPFSIYRKEILTKLGGFDENNLTEDNEIALRFIANGYKIQNCIDGYVHTLSPKTLAGLYRQRLRWNRGNIENCIKYKSLFFNAKNPYVGFLVLPMFVASFGAISGTLAFFFYNIGKYMLGIAEYFRKLLLIKVDIRPFLSSLSSADAKEAAILYLLNINVINLIYMAIFMLVVLILYAAFKHSREQLKNYNKFSLLAYLFVYFPILSVTWCAALAYHLFGVRQQWGCKT